MSGKNKKIYAKLIANPGSGKESNRAKLLEQVTKSLKDKGFKVDVAVAKPKEKAIPIVKRAIKDGYKVIIAMGGDDTVEAVIRGMAGAKKVRLGILPAGTANNLAKSLGIPEDLEAACALIADGNVRKLDMGEVRVGKGKKLPFFELVTMGIAAAIYPDALHVSKGRLSSVKGLIQTVISHEARPEITVVMDGESNITVESMLAIVSNVPLIGPNMLVDPDASMDDGFMDVSLYPGFNKAELLSYFARVSNEGNAKVEGIQRYRAQKLKIKANPKQEVLADGVMLGKGKVKIKVLPGALRVYAPPPGAGYEKPAGEAGVELPAPVAPAETKKSADDRASKENGTGMEVIEKTDQQG